jgi:uncharacterized surface protein with fasciclin (FAS1) repeats
MSNDDGFAPPPPEDGSESGLGDLAAEPPEDGATGPGAGATDPTQAMPPSGGGDVEPTADPTQVMPTGAVTPPSNPVQSGEGIPPIVPPAAATIAGEPVVPAEEFHDEPWYKQPRAWALIGVGVIIVGLLIVLLFLLGDDDDDGGLGELSTDPVVLVVVRNQSDGAALDTTISVSVSAEQPTPNDYLWIAPEDAVVGQPAELQTDATGRAEFRWAPAEGNPDGTWATTVGISESIAPEGSEAVSGIGADCDLERDGSTRTLAVQTNVQTDPANDVGLGLYGFPNATFLAGDRITCTMVNQFATPPPTTVAETTTTVPETTTTSTTVVETTAAPTTAAPTTAAPTTAAPTTAAPTTAAPTTAAPTTAAPTTAPSAPTLGDFLIDSGLTGFRDLLAQAGVLGEIESSSQPFTLFAATDQAVNDFLSTFDPVSTNLEDVVRAHLSYEGALESADLEPLQELDVEFGGPQPLDFTAQPPTIGGAEVIDVDNAVEDASAGVVHVIDTVLTPEP